MTGKNNGKTDRASRKKKSKNNIRQLKDLLASLPTELRLFSKGNLIHFE